MLQTEEDTRNHTAKNGAAGNATKKGGDKSNEMSNGVNPSKEENGTKSNGRSSGTNSIEMRNETKQSENGTHEGKIQKKGETGAQLFEVCCSAHL